jgi:hypothetical protein
MAEESDGTLKGDIDASLNRVFLSEMFRGNKNLYLKK